MAQNQKLHILLLGTPDVQIDNESLRIQRRLLRVLLFYLACHTDPVSRSELCLLFYPDESEEISRRRLREFLAKLRRELPNPNLLIVDQDKIGIDLTQVHVDALEFERSYTEIMLVARRLPPGSSLPESVYLKATLAISLWRAPRFMTGINLPPGSEALDRWFDETSRYYETLRQNLLEALVAHAQTNGDFESATTWLAAMLPNDPFNARVYTQIIQNLQRLGRQHDARLTCERAHNLFLEEGLEEISLEFERLAEEITQVETLPDQEGWSEWSGVSSSRVGYVGRTEPLQHLIQVYQRGGAAVISGEAGVGKTRLVYEFFQRQEPNPRLFYAPARPLEDSLPLQPLVDMLRYNIQQNEWQALAPIWRTQMLRLLPELSNPFPDTPQPGSSVKESLPLIFEAMRQILLLAARSQRLLLFLDDIQWADETTCAALGYLLERGFFSENGLLIMAVRPYTHNPHFLHLTNRLQRILPHYLTINIGRLNQTEIGELAAKILMSSPAPELVEHLQKKTGGNPLFIIETLRKYLSNIVDDPYGFTLPLVGSIHAIIRDRLRQLTSPTRQALNAIAILGDEATPELVGEVALLSEEQRIDAIEELETYQILRPKFPGASQGTLAFIHDLTREAVTLEISTTRRTVLHRRAAKALQKQWAGDLTHAARLARYFENGNEFESAFTAYIDSATYARRIFNQEDVRNAYQKAERLIQMGASISDQLIYYLYTEWGEYSFEMQDEICLRHCSNALQRFGEQHGNPQLLGAGLRQLVKICILKQQYSEGLQTLQRSVPYSEQSGLIFEKAENCIWFSWLLAIRGEYQSASEQYVNALSLLEGTHNPQTQRLLLNAETQMSLVLTLQTSFQAAEEKALQAIERSRQLVAPPSEARAYAMLSSARYYLGKHEDGLADSQFGLLTAENLQAGWLLAYLHITAARNAFSLGYLDEAESHRVRAAEVANRFNLIDSSVHAWIIKGDILFFLGDFLAASQAYNQGINIAAGKESLAALEAMCYLGISLCSSGNLPQGIEWLQQSLAFSKQIGLQLISFPAEAMLAAFLLLFQDNKAEYAHLDQILVECRDCNYVSLVLTIEYFLSQSDSADGNVPLAIERLQRIIHEAHQRKMFWHEWRALGMLGKIAERYDLAGHNVAPRQSEMFTQLRRHTSRSEFTAYLSSLNIQLQQPKKEPL